jgi:stage IV sporulation protein FB
MRSIRDGRIHTSEFGLRLYQPGTNEPVKPTEDMTSKIHKSTELHEAVVKSGLDRPIAARWLVWVDRVFWVSWVLLLINLLPGYPLDGGPILEALVWSRTDRDQGVQTAGYAGYVVAVLMLVASIAGNEVWPMALGLFVALASWLKMNPQVLEDHTYGDFSAGYSSLGDDDEPPRRPLKRQSLYKRWATARKARRIHRESEQQQRDEDRLDQLLDKIARKEPLTAEEQAFMKRVSSRYKNR